jgi:predicted phage terminase large subunit-like protein
LGGGIFKDSWWKYYNPNMNMQYEYLFITGDTAQKTGSHNDYSVFMCFGINNNNLYLIDVVRGKWESPELKQVARDFYNKYHRAGVKEGRLRAVYIEDKSSGTDVIQNLRREFPVIPVQRGKDKVTRAMDVVPYCASGRVFLPENASWLSDFKDEVRKFTPLMSP